MKRILILLITTFMGCMAYCQHENLDSSFGKDAFVSAQYPSLINSVAQLQDGKLLAAGGFYDLNGLIARFLPDGTLDSSFGNNGGAVSNPPGSAYDMVMMTDGRILVCGEFVDENDNTQSFVARFTHDGKPDSSFGIKGTSIIPKLHSFDAYTEIALNTDESIITGGLGYNNPNTLDSQYSIISRLSADGVFDYEFGNGGHVINLTTVNMKDLAIQKDDKIVTAGYNFAGGFQQQDFVFSRYNADGVFDKSFGKNGNIIIDGFGGEDVPNKIIIQQDGKLVFGGYSSADKYYMSALRFNSDGSLDKTFGNGGKVFIDFEDSASKAYDMIQQPDGKFILAGGAYKYQNTSLDGGSFGLCRINNDGGLDSSFGVNGTQITNYLDGGEAYCATLQTDGKILLGGYYQAYEGANQAYLMVRYDNDMDKSQTIISKIRHWFQHHNGFTWNANSTVSSYAVQRSYNGIHFNSIAKINAGSSHNYTYEDVSPLSGANYYRLQTTSVDGAVTYSNVLAVSYQPLAISISPNPAKNNLHIEGLSSNQKIKITVVNFTGTVAISQQLSASSSSSYNLNTAQLKGGNYLLKIEMNNKVVTRKFVKE